MARMPQELTQSREDAAGVDSKSGKDLLPLVHEELRSLAAARMAQEREDHTLQPTALVHEAWIRLSSSNQQWKGRTHFFSAAAEAMRRILIDQARRKAAQKRGASPEMEEFHESRIELKVPEDEILAVHELIDRLAAEDAQAAQVVKLRYFVGMSNLEVAEALEMAPRSVDRHWAYARAWLKNALKPPRS